MEGISVEVIDPRTLQPLDIDTSGVVQTLLQLLSKVDTVKLKDVIEVLVRLHLRRS